MMPMIALQNSSTPYSIPLIILHRKELLKWLSYSSFDRIYSLFILGSLACRWKSGRRQALSFPSLRLNQWECIDRLEKPGMTLR